MPWSSLVPRIWSDVSTQFWVWNFFSIFLYFSDYSKFSYSSGSEKLCWLDLFSSANDVCGYNFISRIWSPPTLADSPVDEMSHTLSMVWLTIEFFSRITFTPLIRVDLSTWNHKTSGVWNLENDFYWDKNISADRVKCTKIRVVGYSRDSSSSWPLAVRLSVPRMDSSPHNWGIFIRENSFIFNHVFPSRHIIVSKYQSIHKVLDATILSNFRI